MSFDQQRGVHQAYSWMKSTEPMWFSIALFVLENNKFRNKAKELTE